MKKICGICCELLKEQIEKLKNEWIPVSESLPMPFVKVLLIQYKNEYVVGFCDREDNWYDNDRKKLDGINYWIPIPPKDCDNNA